MESSDGSASAGHGVGGPAVVEADDGLGDRVEVVFDGEMPGVEANEFGVGQVTQVGLATFWSEEDVALALDDESWGLVLAERCLPGRVQRGVGSVVVEQVELYAMCVGAGSPRRTSTPWHLRRGCPAGRSARRCALSGSDRGRSRTRTPGTASAGRRKCRPDHPRSTGRRRDLAWSCGNQSHAVPCSL